jgi:hypothetical protein
MEELLKALGPWPLVQGIVIGLIVAAIGAWAIRRGLQDSKKNEPSIEDIKSRWELHRSIGHLDKNSFEIVDLLKRGNELVEQLTAAVNRLADSRWNAKQ